MQSSFKKNRYRIGRTHKGDSRMNGQNRNEIKIGALVDIVLKQDQRSGNLTRGHVARILTKSPFHPHGIKVMLEEGGAVGRVKTILAAETEPGKLK